MAPASLRMVDGDDTRRAVGALPRDLGTFNRWLKVSRIRRAAGIALAASVLEAMRPGTFELLRPSGADSQTRKCLAPRR